MEKLTAGYWQQRYEAGYTGWDLGHISRPLKRMIDQIDDKTLKILVPGAGNGYEVAYLHEQGFSNVFLLDWAALPLEHFAEKYPDFPEERLLHLDFFSLDREFELVLEQTFFCALDPVKRPDYVRKMWEILVPKGQLMGLLFNVPLFDDRPPFGGSEKEYHLLFSGKFHIEYLAPCEYSEPDRQGMELEFRMIRK